MNKRLYSRLVYSMAYVCAVFIFAFSSAGIPNDILIAFAIACLVAGGFINSEGSPIVEAAQKPKQKLTTIDDEMREARKMAEVDAT